jgi:hypothetical protein
MSVAILRVPRGESGYLLTFSALTTWSALSKTVDLPKPYEMAIQETIICITPKT